MIFYDMQYPGDPPSVVIEMTRPEFQERFRPSQWTMTSESGTESFPVGREEISCDLCGADPGDTIFVWLYGTGGCRGYCRACFQESKAPYCTRRQEV